MDKNEVSIEIENFLKFNAEDIRDLMQLNPDLLTAFSGVVSAIDEQYGVGSLGAIDDIINPPQALRPAFNRSFTTDFVIGDYLNDVNSIYVPFKILDNDGTISDIEYEIGFNFKGFEDVLIVKSIYEIEGETYYATMYSKDIILVEDKIQEYHKVFLFKTIALDNYYFDYFDRAGKTAFPIGSYILCPKLDFNDRQSKFANKKLSRYKTDVTFEKLTIVSHNNGFVESFKEYDATIIYDDSEIMYVADIQNVDDRNFYIVTRPNSTNFCFEASKFDECFANECPSIKNNSVFTRTTTFGVSNYYWFKSIGIEYNSIIYKMTNFNEKMSIVDIVSDKDDISNFNNSWFKDYVIYKMTPLECREFIAEYEKNNPMVTKIIGLSQSGVSATRPDYMSKAIENNGTRLSPTTSATLFEIGDKMIGSDGFLWEISADKNNRKRWVIGENVVDDLPTELYPNDIPTPTYTFSLSVLRAMETSLESTLGLFDPNDEDYKNVMKNINAVKQYIMYYPNIDLNS